MVHFTVNCRKARRKPLCKREKTRPVNEIFLGHVLECRVKIDTPNKLYRLKFSLCPCFVLLTSAVNGHAQRKGMYMSADLLKRAFKYILCY